MVKDKRKRVREQIGNCSRTFLRLFANFFKIVRELFNLQTIFINFRVLILWHFSKSKEEDYRSVVSASSDGWKTSNNRLGGGPNGIDFDGEPW